MFCLSTRFANISLFDALIMTIASSLQDPVDSVLYDQKGDGAGGVLGHLVASDGSLKYEISNCHCIGR